MDEKPTAIPPDDLYLRLGTVSAPIVLDVRLPDDRTAAVVGAVLHLAIWCAIHNVLRTTLSVRARPWSFDAPATASLDIRAFVLSLAAAIRSMVADWIAARHGKLAHAPVRLPNRPGAYASLWTRRRSQRTELRQRVMT
jgi:hypothetical protein